MANRYTRRINLYINGKEVKNDIKSVSAEMRKLQNEQRRMTIGSREYQAHSKKIKQLDGIIQNHRKSIRSTQSMWSRAGDAINKYMGLAMGIAAAFTGAIMIMKKFKTVIDDFEESITNVYTLLDDADFEKYKNLLDQGAVDLIKKYGFEIKDTNKALFDTISAGVPAGKAIKFLNEAAVLAQGGVTSLTVSVDGMSSVLNAYNLEIEDASRVTSAFFTAQKYGKTTVEELSNSIGKVVPIAAQAGVSYKELLSGVAAMTTQGIKTNLAMTAMKNTIQSVLKPSREAAKVLEELGVPVGTTAVRAQGLGVVLEKLNVAIENNPDAISKAIPNIRGLIGVSALAGNGLEKYHQILQQVNIDYGEGSSLAKAHAKQMETNVQKMRTAIGQRKAAILSLKEELSPVFLQAIKLSTLSTRVFLKFIQIIVRNKEAFIALLAAITAYYSRLLLLIAVKKASALATAAHTAAIWAQIAVTGKATMAQKRLLVATRATNLAMKSTPWGLIISLIAGAAAAFISYKNKIKETITEQSDFNEVLRESNELLGQNKTIEERAKIIKNLSERQLEDFKATLQNQIDNEEDFHSKLLSKLKKRLEEDEKLNQLHENLKQENLTEFQKENLRIAIQYRKEQLARELQDQDEASKKRLKKYRSYLKEVQKYLNEEPEEQPTGNENTEEAKKALDLAHKQELLQLKKFYADKEHLKEEYNAREMALEIAHLKAMENLETDLTKKLDLQLKIIDAQTKYKDALKLAIPEIIANEKAEEKLNTRLLETAKLMRRVQERQEQADEQTQQLTEEQRRQAENLGMISNTMVDYVSAAVSGTLDEYATFGDAMILMSLQILKQMAPIWAAQIIGGSLATPQSIMSGGIAGIAQFTALLAIMQGAIAIAESAVNKGIENRRENRSNQGRTPRYAKGGYTQGETVYIAGEKEKEWIAPGWMVNHPVFGKMIENFEAMRTRRTSINQTALPQFANGGFTGTTNNPVITGSPGDAELKKLLTETTKALKELRYAKENPPALPIDKFEQEREKYLKIQQTSGL